MMTQLYYSVVRHVPDSARDEALNLGIVLVGPGYLDLRASSDLQRIRKLDSSFDQRRLEALETSWLSELKQRRNQDELSAEQFLLRLASQLSLWQTQVTEPRLVEVESDTGGDQVYDEVLDELFDRLVRAPEVPRSARRQRTVTIKSRLKRDLRQKKLLDTFVKPDSIIQGSLPYQVSFLYENGHQVAIDTVEPSADLGGPTKLSGAVAETFGKWSDIRATPGHKKTDLISVIPAGTGADIRKARTLLAKISTVYCYPDEEPQLMSRIEHDYPGRLEHHKRK